MRSAAVCIAFVLTYTSGSFVAGLRYIDPQAASKADIGNTRLDLTEPTCDELRAMWRYTKRQIRAAKTTNGFSMYSYNPNIWQQRGTMYKPDSKLSRGYTRDIVAPTRLKLREELEGRHAGRPRNRAAGSPIYGRMVHKGPPGIRWRNGMRGPSRMKVIEDLSRHFGTVNTGPYKIATQTKLRGGGVSSLVPQSGRFETLKNLIQVERARELQEQHIAEEEMKQNAFKGNKDLINEEQLLNRQQLRKQFFNPPLLEMTPNVNYDYNQRRYNNPPNIGQAWSVCSFFTSTGADLSHESTCYLKVMRIAVRKRYKSEKTAACILVFLTVLHDAVAANCK
ncbi:PREDICTED: uncharacterized protein LOC108776459 [Cyphomyrmex costatus]|uniref:uncharacterized protein LOC108776459 n=1 Tax=Cyphomyrmex costatus TaxID=456900 RepID=UPI0008522B1A|nr:PREDICTED: uncharacterized protein LOC108776459 [Cyphomyrmex costatus]